MIHRAHQQPNPRKHCNHLGPYHICHTPSLSCSSPSKMLSRHSPTFALPRRAIDMCIWKTTWVQPSTFVNDRPPHSGQASFGQVSPVGPFPVLFQASFLLCLPLSWASIQASLRPRTPTEPCTHDRSNLCRLLVCPRPLPPPPSSLPIMLPTPRLTPMPTATSTAGYPDRMRFYRSSRTSTLIFPLMLHTNTARFPCIWDHSPRCVGRTACPRYHNCQASSLPVCSATQLSPMTSPAARPPLPHIRLSLPLPIESPDRIPSRLLTQAVITSRPTQKFSTSASS